MWVNLLVAYVFDTQRLESLPWPHPSCCFLSFNLKALVKCYFRYIDACLDPAQINPSDAPAAFNEIAESAYGPFVLFEHFMETWSETPVPPG